MRTIIKNIKEGVVRTVCGGKNYRVSGEIIFHLVDGINPNLFIFDQAIRKVDDQFPWHDDDNLSTGYKSYGTEVLSGYRVQCSLKTDLRRGQIYAYERYLANLAEELLKELKGDLVRNVSYRITITSFNTVSRE